MALEAEVTLSTGERIKVTGLFAHLATTGGRASEVAATVEEILTEHRARKAEASERPE